MYLNGAETARLKIRSLELCDIPTWESFFENNHSLSYLGIDLSLDKKQQSRAWIDRQLERYSKGLYGHHALILKEKNEFIGQCGLLVQTIDGIKEIEIGYHVLPKYWGNGFATEAAIKFRDYAFKNMISDSLISVIDIWNTASQNVAKKLGMKNEKQTKCFGLDVFIYRINLS